MDNLIKELESCATALSLHGLPYLPIEEAIRRLRTPSPRTDSPEDERGYWSDGMLSKWASGELPLQVPPGWRNATLIVRRAQELAVLCRALLSRQTDRAGLDSLAMRVFMYCGPRDHRSSQPEEYQVENYREGLRLIVTEYLKEQ